jgi:hypothetical protein
MTAVGPSTTRDCLAPSYSILPLTKARRQTCATSREEMYTLVDQDDLAAAVTLLPTATQRSVA